MFDLKQIARDIFRDALAGVDIPAAMGRKLALVDANLTAGEATVNFSAYRSVRAVAIGKAAVSMASGLSTLLTPDIVLAGILVTPHDSLAAVPGFRVIGAGHPLPDEGSLMGARAILDLLAAADASTLIFFLLSGGGSALVELPLDPRATLDDLRRLYRLLVHCGAPIDEINAVRKHVSAVKGGRLAAAAAAATKLTLGVSDVPEGRESALASGPTLPDPTTVADACRVIEQYALMPKLPLIFQEIFSHPERMPETPKPGDPAFAQNHFLLLLDSRDLLDAARRAAEANDCVAICDNSTNDWPIGKAANHLLQRLERLRDANPGRRVAILADGEVSFASDRRRRRRTQLSLRARLRRENSRQENRRAQCRNGWQRWLQPSSWRGRGRRDTGACARRRSRSTGLRAPFGLLPFLPRAWRYRGYRADREQPTRLADTHRGVTTIENQAGMP